MSKKTKEEKIVAAYRKKIKLLQQLANLNNQKKENQTIKPDLSVREVGPLSTSGKTEKPIISVSPTWSVDKDKESSIDQSRRIYFIQDLKKSFIIISFIITLEIIIYFASIKDYLRLGL